MIPAIQLTDGLTWSDCSPAERSAGSSAQSAQLGLLQSVGIRSDLDGSETHRRKRGSCAGIPRSLLGFESTHPFGFWTVGAGWRPLLLKDSLHFGYHRHQTLDAVLALRYPGHLWIDVAFLLCSDHYLLGIHEHFGMCQYLDHLCGCSCATVMLFGY